MTKVIHIEASPRKKRSHSIKVANHFLNCYRKHNPADCIEVIDLWNYPLPEFDEKTIEAKYAIMHGKSHNDEQRVFWDKIVTVFNHFNSADKYVFSIPMWNYSIPYKLKHFIDIITQPSLAFKVDPDKGIVGLVTNKPALLIYTSGGTYSKETKQYLLDFQKPYMKTYLEFIGFKDIKEIIYDKTLFGKKTVEESEKFALDQASKFAKIF